jgi:hypothetical protein
MAAANSLDSSRLGAELASTTRRCGERVRAIMGVLVDLDDVGGMVGEWAPVDGRIDSFAGGHGHVGRSADQVDGVKSHRVVYECRGCDGLAST